MAESNNTKIGPNAEISDAIIGEVDRSPMEKESWVIFSRRPIQAIIHLSLSVTFSFGTKKLKVQNKIREKIILVMI